MVTELRLWAAKKFFYKDGKTPTGKYIKVQQWNRTLAEQKENVKNGVSWTLYSKHLKGLAVDLVLMKDGQPVWHDPIYEFLGEKWQSMGGVWGGSWIDKNDVYHFEYNEEKRNATKNT